MANTDSNSIPLSVERPTKIFLRLFKREKMIFKYFPCLFEIHLILFYS